MRSTESYSSNSEGDAQKLNRESNELLESDFRNYMEEQKQELNPEDIERLYLLQKKLSTMKPEEIQEFLESIAAVGFSFSREGFNAEFAIARRPGISEGEVDNQIEYWDNVRDTIKGYTDSLISKNRRYSE